VDDRLDIYLIAIGGTGMAPIACLLKQAGHTVRGADGPLYPPMSTLLEQAGIEPLVGYQAAHLDPAPDLVIVGNAVPSSNPEALETEALGLEHLSMPQALSQFFLDDRKPLVIAGTHGKTTTTSIAAWVYTDTGQDPGFLIGGVPHDLGRSFARGQGERFIIEGDEYNAAYFDRGPKFLHYQPQTLILTSVEYDHADLYPSPESLLEAYRSLVRLLPDDGLLIAWGDSPEVRAVAAEASCPVLFYGISSDNDIHPTGAIAEGPNGVRFTLQDNEAGEVEISLALAGEHNVLNAMSVWAAARADGISAENAARALGAFGGVRRRMDELGTAGGVTVVDDFAHHPTAIGSTIEALRGRYRGRRMVVLFEPRSLTAGRDFLYPLYLEALAKADVALLAPIFHRGRLTEEECLDTARLTHELAEAGIDAEAFEDNQELFEATLARVQPDDLVVTMSSGDFGSMPQRLLTALG
jgi:UDP-N-acetylmuramate: L-alanyl-gamma-D-glutamyl-meso-diaminopimelate ligase